MENYNHGVDMYKERMLVINMAKEVDYKNHKLLDMEHKMEEIHATNQKLLVALKDHVDDKKRFLLAMERKDRERRATIDQLRNENDRLRGLMNEKDVLCRENFEEIQNFLSINKQLKQQKMLVQETEKRQKEELYAKIIQQQKELDGIPLLELEIQKLKGTINIVKHDEESGDVEAQKKMDQVLKDLAEKEEQLEGLEALNQTLMVKDRESNDELQAARKELITGLRDMLTRRSTLQIRQMGAIDPKPFQDMCSEKFPHEDWSEMSAKLCSQWEEEVRRTDWHPFKQYISTGKPQVIIDEGDRRLKWLRDECGEAVQKAVADALLEMNEYNPSGRYPIPEVWKVKEGRKATLKEIVEYLINQLKTQKRKRKRTYE